MHNWINCYPPQRLGNLKLHLGFTYKYLHKISGIDFGPEFHKNQDVRIASVMELDRKVYQLYGDIGLGYKNPFPRFSVEPQGHRLLPAVFGCPIIYAKDSEPWAVNRIYTNEEILELPDWTVERFEKSEPIIEVVQQAKYLHGKYGKFTSIPNLGSTINTAIYLMGDNLFINYIESPDIVRKLFDNITQLFILCMKYFQKLDEKKLEFAEMGNCCVSMISPADYFNCNFDFDKKIEKYCSLNGIHLGIHQDSRVEPHFENYAKFNYVNRFEFGMDCDFNKFAGLRPDADISMILFDHWIAEHNLNDIRQEIRKLINIGRKFKSMTLTCLGIDSDMSEKLIDFYNIVEEESSH